jgi:hypothetical protein
MATMGSYCKAYPIERFREYKDWSEQPRSSEPAEGSDAPDNYLFLQENLTVTGGIFLDEDVVYDKVTEEWRTFCHESLKFEVPDFELEHNESVRAQNSNQKREDRDE